MKRFFAVFMALFVFAGPNLYAEDFAVSVSSTTAVGQELAVEPFQWPVSKQIGTRKVQIVSKFGHRKAPDTQLDEVHEGIDFAVPESSNVRAAQAGKVLFAGFSSAYVSRKDKKDKNHLVIVRHMDGRSTRYVHMNQLRVKPGLEVKAGDILGTSSASDELKEPVLHFEVRDAAGKALDPLPLFVADIVKEPVLR